MNSRDGQLRLGGQVQKKSENSSLLTTASRAGELFVRQRGYAFGSTEFESAIQPVVICCHRLAPEGA